jgi:hypothetical protein
MPYEIKPVLDGYKVFKEHSRRTFSRLPLTEENAMKQMRALYANVKDMKK